MKSSQLKTMYSSCHILNLPKIRAFPLLNCQMFQSKIVPPDCFLRTFYALKQTIILESVLKAKKRNLACF